MAETTSQLQTKLKALTDGKVDIMADADTFKNTTQILREMSKEWQNMTDVEQAAALELLGGKRQANTLSAIISNFDIVEDAIEASANSAGSALRENEKVLDSIQGRINQFNNALQTMWNNALDSDFIKSIVDFGTELVKIVDKVGLLNSVLITLGTRKIFGTLFESLKKDGVTIKSVWNLINQLTLATRQQQIADAAAAGTTLSRMNAEKLLNLSIVKRFATEQIDAKLKEANMAREVTLVAAKEALALAEEQHAEGLIDDIALQSAKNAVDAASIPITSSQIGVTGILGATFKGLAASIWDATKAIAAFLFTNPVGWFVLAIGAVAGGVAIFNHFHKTTEELAEGLSEVRSELSDIQSEIDSLNSELKTTNDRIAELLALPSLSFVEQEELANLQRATAELERQLEIKEQLAKSKEDEAISASKKYIDSAWYSKGVDKTYAINYSTGVIKKDGFLDTGIDTKTALDTAMTKYQAADSGEKAQQYLLAHWDEIDWKDINEEINQLANDALGTSGTDYSKGINRGLNFKSRIEGKKWSEQKQQIADGINMVLSDESFDDLKYGQDAEINAFLDELYAYQLKWEQAQGGYIKSTAMRSMFDATANESMQTLGKQLQEISDDDKLTDNQKNQQILGILDSLDGIDDGVVQVDKLSDSYKRLQTTMEITGMTAQDIADYFVLENGIFDSNTIQGLTAQYTYALGVMNEIKGMNSDGIFEIDGKQYDWDEFFTTNDEGKFKARAQVFSQILKGLDEDARETFMSLSEQVKNEAISWSQALEMFKYEGDLAGIELITEQITSLNSVYFGDAAENFNGLIDTVDELSAALDNVSASMDLLNSAQEEFNNNGRISVKTALELMSSTDNWDKVLTITNGTIELTSDAEEVLIQEKLDHIKANYQTALSEVQTQIAALKAKTANEELSMTLDQSTNESVRTLAASMAYLNTMMEANARLASGEIISVDTWKEKAQTAYNDTYNKLYTEEAKPKTSSQTLAELEAEEEKLQKQLELIEHIDSIDEFESNYSSDNNTTESALEALQEKYERKIKNLEGQQTYLENEVERLEAEDKAVSKDYYEEQIDLEQQKIDLYKQERAELLKLKRTDEVAEQLWEVEHAIQESTLRMIEFRKSITKLYEEAFSETMEAYANKEDFTGDQQSYIEKYMELSKMQGNDIDALGYQSLIDIETKQLKDNVSELEDLRAALAQGLASGDIEEGGQAWVQMQSNIRDTEAAILDNNLEIEKYKKSLKELAVTDFDNSRQMFSNKDQFLSNQQKYVEGYITQLENLGIDVPQEAYEELIRLEQKKKDNNIADLADARSDLDELVAKGYTEADKEWQDAYQQVVDIEKAIQDNDIAMAEWNNTMLDMDFSKLEEFLTLLKEVNTEVRNMDYVVSQEEAYNDDGTWTEAGITSLGLKYQDYVNSQAQRDQYSAEIQRLKDAWNSDSKYYDADGDGQGETLTEAKYDEYLKNLTNGYWDSLKDMYQAKEDMIAMEEARIDKIEEAVNREIEAYQDLIDVKKEELEAERDLYEFKKDIEKQTKDLAALDRKIASLSGSTDAGDIAELRKLQAERAELQEGLNDTYYNHSKDQQGKALDEEMSSYQKTMDDYMETLREGLKDTEAVFEKLITEVGLNADIVLKQIEKSASENKTPTSSSLIDPWVEAGKAAAKYKSDTETNLNGLIGDNGVITLFSNKAKEQLSLPFTAATAEGGPIATFKSAAEKAIQDVKIKVSGADGKTNYLGNGLTQPWKDATKEDGPIATFDDKVGTAIDSAKQKVVDKKDDIGNGLTQPWIDATKEGSPLSTFDDKVAEVYDKTINIVREKVKQINAENDKIKDPTPSYEGSGTVDSGGGTNNNPGGGTTVITSAEVTALQKILNKFFNAGVTVDGKYGPRTKQGVANMQVQLNKNFGNKVVDTNGLYDTKTRNALKQYLNARPVSAWFREQNISVPAAMYAKGTLGTKSSGFAITDESWIGEEITLAAGKNGQLQYLKKGSAVMPADISANLVEWGKLNPDMLKVGVGANLNMINNAVNKPEFNLSFEALVKAERIDEGTLPEVKKYVSQEINNLIKQMNYAIKGYAR